MADRLGVRELAALANVPVEDIERLIALGILTSPAGDEPFTQGDVHRVRLVMACERAGLAAERISAAIREGRLSLSYVDAEYSFAAGPTSETFAVACERHGIDIDLATGRSNGRARPARPGCAGNG